ncbi:hypothetical protein TELCIR_16650 [Teladorsagia circumcincta]|uniref:Uncharacterized protein n=1 Tax=Teladorsagia circumcincta TaxID=45464 RepID=A0A2G9TWJ0_TELCI|nr:hypothetical protein TELCIR_16650 [Teladorsagia circumcincta]
MERNGDQNSDITFVVRHVDIFKASIQIYLKLKPNYATHLPTIINTPSSDAGCGIKLQIGKEYLLADFPFLLLEFHNVYSCALGFDIASLA